MDDIQVVVGLKEYTIPYRDKSGPKPDENRIQRLCRQSRDSDGYKRLAAIKKLLQEKTLPETAIPYVVMALCDYVTEIHQIPLQANAAVQKGIRHFASNNEAACHQMEQVMISYWNEYYSYDFPTYHDYPPYAFLQSLKGEATGE